MFSQFDRLKVQVAPLFAPGKKEQELVTPVGLIDNEPPIQTTNLGGEQKDDPQNTRRSTQLDDTFVSQ